MSPFATSNHPDPAANGRDKGNERISAGQSAVFDPLQRLAQLIADSPHNLVSAGERPQVFERHILECVALADAVVPKGRWMDLGTGGGLPGLVLAIRHPAVAWTLVDATAKKVDAVRAFAAELGLTNVEAVQARAESLAHEPSHRGAFDGVVTRALAALPTLVELCRGFVGPNGRILAVKGPNWRTELDAAAPALAVLRLHVVSTDRLDAPARDSWVVTMRADGAPPTGYPRRDGVPKADPIR